MMGDRRYVRGLGGAVTAAALALCLITPAVAMGQAPVDDRSNLGAGWLDAESVSDGLELLTHRDRPPGFFDPTDPGNGAFSNTDLAFRGSQAFVGNYNGFNVYDITDPTSPEHLVSVVCPGGQGDLSIHGDLLFMSVQENRSRVDCGLGTPEDNDNPVLPERFRGVRIFDVSDAGTPVQVAAVQTCRGSHTHTLVRDPDDDENVYIYVSGTSPSRLGEELAGCGSEDDPNDPDTAYWRISVIQVPIDAPDQARVIAEPRVFTDPSTGSIDGLWPGGDHGPDTQQTSRTSSCHDITAYPEIGLAAGACQGNGVLFDISDPANPFRIDEVSDPNFAYWHSATFNNDGTKVLFTDEWGGGTAARCQAGDPADWGANAVFDLVNRRLVFGGYYKLPTAQSDTENCVAHNGSLIPVPGRDIKVQAWYQGGVSVFDFTDSENPFEIAYFDRGPISDEDLMLGGYWSSYWYNGYVYGSEIARGFDVLELEPSEYLSENEIAAARLVQYDQFNPQEQPRVVWPAAFVVARARLDQLARIDGVDDGRIDDIRDELDDIEGMAAGAAKRAALAELAVSLWSDAGAATGDEAEHLRALAGSVLDLAGAQ